MADPGKTISPLAEAVAQTALKPLLEPQIVPELHALPKLRLDEDGDVQTGAEVQITGVLGVGGMGRIELGRQPAFGRDVAIKRVRPDRYCTEAVSALVRESRFIGQLEHPNIVPVHQLGLDGAGRPILVMKRIDGASWASLAPSLPLERNLEIARQVCNAIEFAHRRGVLHRDLKLDNVMVGELGEVYVLDWGIAVEMASAAVHDFAGTPAYMAPEMIDSTASLDARTDVYLLGAMLHEVLTGEVRHAGSDMREVLDSARRSEPFVYAAPVPAELGELCNRACARDPAHRPASALAFSEAIGEFLKHRGSIELAERVEKRRLELELALLEQRPADRVRTLITEAMFGFRQALEVWPENPLARAGLQSAGELAVGFELSQRNAAGAEAAFAALPQPRPELAGKILALRAEVDAAATAQRELKSMRDAADLRIGSRFRTALGPVLLWPLGVADVLLARAGLTPTWPMALAVISGVFVAMSALLASRWKVVAANVAGKRHAMALILIAGFATLIAAVGAFTGAPLQFTVSAAFILVGCGFVVVALWSNRGLFLSGAAAVIGGLAVALGPNMFVSMAIACFLLGAIGLFRTVRGA